MNQLKKASFVNTLAWLFIILAGLTTLISILQNVMIYTMLPLEEMNKALKNTQGQVQIPAVFHFMFSNIQIIFLAFLAVSASTFISAIGLLKRKNWARIIFIFIMGTGIFFNVGGLMLQNSIFSSMPDIPATAMDSQFATIMTVMKAVSFVFSMGISYLFGWIIYTLTSPDIKAEFTGHLPAGSGMATDAAGQPDTRKKKIILAIVVVLTIITGIVYFSTGNIKTTSTGGDIQAIAISGDAAKLSQLLKEQPQLAKAEWGEANWPPLHFAACNGKTECVRLLIEAGANVNAQTCGQGTALHCSAEEGYTEIVALLLKANADPNIKDSKGKTPLDFAVWNNHMEVIDLLKNNNAKTGKELEK
jgi:hypothetical protein